MSSTQVVDWLKCIICQKETAEKTQCPANSKRNDSGAGYLTIEHDLTLFHEAGELHYRLTGKIWMKEMEFLKHFSNSLIIHAALTQPGHILLVRWMSLKTQ